MSLIVTKTLTLDSNVIDDSAAVTLMSTDVESIAAGLENVQEIWAKLIEVGLANRVLVLDEATSSVDKQTDQFMQRLIREEFKGQTIIAVAHRLNTIVDFDKIVVLEKGRLAEFGRTGELLARDRFSRYVQQPELDILLAFPVGASDL